MSYVNSIGGDPINPNPFTYSAISITGDITLGWPISGQSPTYSATDWIDVTSSAAYAITMPDTRQVGVGQEVVFNNYGSFTITIKDSAGSSITTIAAGFAKRVHIVTNATSAGTWRVVNIGAGTSTADASALAGYGLVALAGQLSQELPFVSYNTNQTIIASARANLALWTGGVGTYTMTAPATLGTDWFFNVRNSGSGTLTINAGAALINGSATLDAAAGEGFTVVTDGSNFYTIGKIAPTSSGLTLLNKSAAGGADVTLTSGESAYNIINFTGVLTANINVIVPTAVRQWYFYNNTTGAFTLTVKTAAGTGIAIAQGSRAILYSDGTNVVSATSSAAGTVTSVASGTGLTGGPVISAGTLSLANTAVAAGTYGGAIGVASHTVDAQGRLTADSFTARSITGTAAEITVTNGDGVAGAPTISIPAALTLTGKTATGGTFTGGLWNGTAIGVAYGGTGLATLTANNVILGNGTGAPSFVAPGTSGNVLTSNGTTWQSADARAPDYQPFTASGVWTKPSGKSSSARVLVQVWAGGAGGTGGGGQYGAGGGGGGYKERWFALSDLAATETVTVGSGGSAANGGNSSFGSFMTAYGGLVGATASRGGAGGGTASQLTQPGGLAYSNDNMTGEGWGGDSTIATALARSGRNAIFSGGGGGGPSPGSGGSLGQLAGNSIYGGGGGASITQGGKTSFGTSMYGGNGGDIDSGTNNGQNGTAPGGGGGGGSSAVLGLGARGEVRVTVY